MFKQQMFYRDANQLDTISTSQEAHLNSSDFGTDVDQVEGLLKKHENFEKLLETQEEKVTMDKIFISFCQHLSLLKINHIGSNWYHSRKLLLISLDLLKSYWQFDA